MAGWYPARAGTADAEAGRIEPIIEAGAGLDPAGAARRHDAAVAEVRERYGDRPEDYIV